MDLTLLAGERAMADESESAAQRRLWFLERLLEKVDAEQALDIAARLEAFVADGPVGLRKQDHRHSAHQNAGTNLPAPQTGKIGPTIDQSRSVAEPPPTATRRGDGGRLLNDAELQAFASRAVHGATNRELGRLFGLTPRQANGIRMALAKRHPQVGLGAGSRLDAGAESHGAGNPDA